MKALGITLAVLAVATLATTANASVLLTDTFSYPDGALVSVPPNGGWVNHSGTAGSLLVSGGQAVVNHAATEDAHTSWTSTSTGLVYFGIDFSVDDLGTPWAGIDSEYFAHFSDGGTFNFRGRIDIVPALGGGDFSVGLSTGASTADITWLADLTFATTYRAIVGYDQDADIAQLWIGASLITDPSIVGFDLNVPGISASAFNLRQSTSSKNETIRVDNLIVATTFGEVVPEPSTLALLGFGGLALIRRRR